MQALRCSSHSAIVTRMHHLQGNLGCCFHEGPLPAVQVVVALTASHVLQNSPQFIVQGVEVWTPWGPILSSDKGQTFLCSHSWVILALWAGAQSCWNTHFWPLKRAVLRCFTTPCSTSSWYNWVPVFTPFLQKWRDITPQWDPPLTKP
jgi:hypothetical protein